MFGYNWQLKDLDSVKKNSLKLFSCFSGGGGSSMGYKMSGVNVLGFCESDKFMADSYLNNMTVKYPFNIPIQDLLVKDDLPRELYDLDILDGSPPCSNFSTLNKTGTKNVYKKSAEGKIYQKLEGLPSFFTSLANKLNPKVIIIENVAQMIKPQFFKTIVIDQIVHPLQKNGYTVQSFILDAKYMGVPQQRNRVFIIARKTGLGFKQLKLNFNDKIIPIRDIKNLTTKSEKKESEFTKKERLMQSGKSARHLFDGKYFNSHCCSYDKPFRTLATSMKLLLPEENFKRFTINAFLQGQSFPIDYRFLKGTSDSKKCYLIGMSVPPLMTHRITEEIKKQWFDIQ